MEATVDSSGQTNQDLWLLLLRSDGTLDAASCTDPVMNTKNDSAPAAISANTDASESDICAQTGSITIVKTELSVATPGTPTLEVHVQCIGQNDC